MQSIVRRDHAYAHNKRNQANEREQRKDARKRGEQQERQHHADRVEPVGRAPLKALRRDARPTHQVAARGTVGSRMAHALDAHHVAVMRSRRELDNGLGSHRGATRTTALRTGIGDNSTRTRAFGADHLEYAHAKKGCHIHVVSSRFRHTWDTF